MIFHGIRRGNRLERLGRRAASLGDRWPEGGQAGRRGGRPRPVATLARTAATVLASSAASVAVPAVLVAMAAATIAATAAAADPGAAKPASGPVAKAACPDRNVLYWQAFPPGGESDLSARHQQVVLKRQCPAIDTIIQYKAGAGGALLWNQMNQMPGDGYNIMGINLPHIVFQPIDGQVQYRTEDIVPVYWFHYTPDTLVVRAESPYRTFDDFIKAARAEPGKLTLGGSGQNSANHAAHERLNADFGVKSIYVPFKGTGDMTTQLLGGQIDGAMSYSGFTISQGSRVRALAIALDKRHPLLPDTPTFRELGIDWVDGAYRGIGMPKSTTLEQRSRMAELWRRLNNDPEMKSLAERNGLELIDIGPAEMEAFMAEKVELYSKGASLLGLGRGEQVPK